MGCMYLHLGMCAVVVMCEVVLPVGNSKPGLEVNFPYYLYS